MPVYGPLIIGNEQFAEETVTEQLYGNNVYGSLVLGEITPEKIAAGKAAAPAAASEPETDDPLALMVAGAAERMVALLGDAYTVSEAEQGLLAHPDIWPDLALAEYGRSKTAGARKGLVKTLLAVESGSDEIKALIASLV